MTVTQGLDQPLTNYQMAILDGLGKRGAPIYLTGTVPVAVVRRRRAANRAARLARRANR